MNSILSVCMKGSWRGSVQLKNVKSFKPTPMIDRIENKILKLYNITLYIHLPIEPTNNFATFL